MGFGSSEVGNDSDVNEIEVSHSDVSSVDPDVHEARGQTLDEVSDIGSTNEISEEDRAKLENWDYRPDDKTYLEHKEVFDNPEYYDQTTGEIQWPENDGFDGGSKEVTLQPGETIDRYGDPSGYYAAPEGTTYEERSLPPGTDELKPYTKYEVVKPIEGVREGKTAPWFAEPGGGTQYEMPESLEELEEEGYIRKV